MEHRPATLIVDDDESTRQTLALILERRGYITETAGSGEEALSIATKNRFRVALLDIKLPDMEGVSLIAPLKEMNPDLDIFMITAYASMETAVSALNEGATAYIFKPLNMDDVLGKVKEAVERQDLVIENRKLLEETQQELGRRKEAEAALKQSESQLRSLAAQLSFSEERLRQHIATDLHDRISQSLAALQWKVELLRSPLSGTSHLGTLDEALQLIRKTNENASSLSLELFPPLLKEIGFEAALEWLVERFQTRYGISSLFEDDGKEKALPEEIRGAIFQMVRELITNVAKHAKAKKVICKCWREGDFLHVQVEDDGVGFTFDVANFQPARQAKFGLFSLKERLRFLGGTLIVNSSPGEGSRITITVPL